MHCYRESLKVNFVSNGLYKLTAENGVKGFVDEIQIVYGAIS
ncbi:hypothetical protein [Bacillus sp. SM2101]|nr:hypothetical protein [Bacillus sp. SM2101]